MTAEYMENLARAYNEKLRGAVNADADTAVEALYEQLSILDSARNSRTPRLLAYIKSIKQSSLSELSPLCGGKKIPCCRGIRESGGMVRLLDLQIELFIALDSMSRDGLDVSNTILMETRASALIANLR